MNDVFAYRWNIRHACISGRLWPVKDRDLVGSTTMRAGTPGFQAPEQLQYKSISSKCDVYAFGGVLTELFGEVFLWPKTPAHQIMFNVAVKGVFSSTDHLQDNIREITKSCFVAFDVRADASQVLAKLLDILNCDSV